MRTLSVLLQELAKVPGQKFVVYLTGADDVSQPRDGAVRFEDLIEAAARARVALHVLRVPASDGLASDASLEQLARETGGTLTTLRPKKDDLGSLVASLSGGYLVELDGTSLARRDRPVSLSVQTTRRSTRLAVASRWSRRDDPIPDPALPPAPVEPARPDGPSTPPRGHTKLEPTDHPAHDSELDAVVARVARYVDTYLEELGSVVAEESYMQIVRLGARAATTRRTRADLLLLRSPSGWQPFRDVFEVDGRPVRDREDRLRKLFLENPGEALKEGRRISDESTRHNIGSAYRTINMPTLTLAFFQAKSTAGFRFQRHGTDKVDGVTVWRVDYKEVASPTQIAHSATGADMPSSGSIWVEPASGRIVKTLLRNGDDGGVAEIVVKYRPNDTLGLWTPAQMQENYSMPSGRRETISTEANYSGFRRFQVNTDEAVAPPK
jgi:hypothetical protein